MSGYLVFGVGTLKGTKAECMLCWHTKAENSVSAKLLFGKVHEDLFDDLEVTEVECCDE